MSWEVIDSNSNAEGIPWVSVSVTGANKKYQQVKISMSKSVVSHLGVAHDGQVMMLGGKGDHVGWVQVQKAPPLFTKGYTLSNRKAATGNLTFRFSSRRLNMKPHKAIKITTDDAALFLSQVHGDPVIQLEIPREMRMG